MPAQPKPKKVGRPVLPKGYAKAKFLRIRVTPDELRTIETAAKSKKLSLSEWIRGTLSGAIGR
jgi:predicted HicB family RNase H-like nuclease